MRMEAGGGVLPVSAVTPLADKGGNLAESAATTLGPDALYEEPHQSHHSSNS